MRAASHGYPELLPETVLDIEQRFRQSLLYFKERGSVVFLSYCHFWERHAQPQQSLAKLLIQNGIKVTWLDGTGWRRYSPTLYWPSPRLEVKQLFELPGRRLTPWIQRLSSALQAEMVKKILKKHGGTPLVWVQGGIEEPLAAKLPYIDVFSFFDDPYRHSGEGDLCRKARLIVTQNSFALTQLQGAAKTKANVLFPPVDISPEAFQNHSPIALPPYFPEKRMGYIGSFFSHDYDLELFEDFVRSLPNWGFFLMGRTDEKGLRHVDRMRRYRNFWSQPWVPRSQVASAWEAIDVSLLFYKACRTQDGAFPTKLLESLYFNVPSVATQLPKTLDVEGIVPRSRSSSELKKLAIKAAETPPDQLARHYHHFSTEMSPKLYLARVAEWLMEQP